MAIEPTSRWRIVHSECSTGWGGQEHRVLAELAGFQRRGSAVWLLAPPVAVVGRRVAAENIPVVPLNPARLLYPLTALRLARWLRQVRAEVVNTHSSRDGWLVGVAARLARVPFLVRTRHIDVDYPSPRLSRHAFTTFADHVLTTSDKITEKFQTLFNLPAEQITTVPTGIDLQRFHPDVVAAALPIPADAAGWPLVGMVSVLRSWKGHATFFEAARLLQKAGVPVHFVVVGGGPRVEYYQNLARDHGVGDRVTFTGHREDIPEILRALSVLVIPSTQHEGVPQIGLQALATRTPVVGSDVGGIPEIIRPGETGRIFPAGNAAALAVAIRETLEAREVTAVLTRRGRAAVEARHSLDAMLDQLDALYRRHIPH